MKPDKRPTEPKRNAIVTYRGWECAFYSDAEFWTGNGWQAYKGGADLDAPNVNARTWDGLLAEIDAQEGDDDPFGGDALDGGF